MFLNLNKKKLKELSNSKLPQSETYNVKGGTGTVNTDKPSITSHSPCYVDKAIKVVN